MIRLHAAFGLRQLVDIATRALSPGTNDPTTAVQSLDRIHDLLRRLAVRRFPSHARAVDGRVRILLNAPVWDDSVHLGLDEIRLAGESQIQVTRRLRAILDDLATVAPGDRQAVVGEEIVALAAVVERGFGGSGDGDLAAEPGARGRSLGSGTRPES